MRDDNADRMIRAAVREPEWSIATIAFVDIRGFTTFADRSTPCGTIALRGKPVPIGVHRPAAAR